MSHETSETLAVTENEITSQFAREKKRVWFMGSHFLFSPVSLDGLVKRPAI